jgi:hypothetical protein
MLVFWVMTLYLEVDTNISASAPEDGGSMFLQNIGTLFKKFNILPLASEFWLSLL